MGNIDAVTRIKNRLAKIALRDTERVMEQDTALQRMAEMGLTSEGVLELVKANPEEVVFGDSTDTSYCGFKDKRQAMMAAFAGMSKGERPATLEDAHKRVTELIKNQVPERAARTIGLAIISIPAMAVEAIPEANIKRFRRLGNGKLRELGPAGIIDVEAEEVGESNVMYKREDK